MISDFSETLKRAEPTFPAGAARNGPGPRRREGGGGHSRGRLRGILLHHKTQFPTSEEEEEMAAERGTAASAVIGGEVGQALRKEAAMLWACLTRPAENRR